MCGFVKNNYKPDGRCLVNKSSPPIFSGSGWEDDK